MLVIDVRRKVLKSVVPYNELDDFLLEAEDVDNMASRNIYFNKPVLLASLFPIHLKTHASGSG